MDVNIRIAGEAGQGLVTAGDVLSDVFAQMGLYVFTTRNYESRIRGGLNWYDIRAGDSELFSRRRTADILVAFTEKAAGELGEDISADGVMISEYGDHPALINIPLSDEARDTAGKAVMANAVALGAIFGLLGYDPEQLCEHVRDHFEKSGEEVVGDNLRCIRRGVELSSDEDADLPAPECAGAPNSLVDGGSALGYGAATAGVKVVSGYPMTPGTAVLTYLVGVADEYGIVVEQAEDELSAINMICGATYAGVPALTATSGGGFALMCEGLSLAGMMELPAFIVLAQRPGPATGLPTRTAQEDLKFVINAGHGEFPRAVYTPGTQEESFEVIRHGLEMAHKYQTPGILLTDQFLIDNRRNVEDFDVPDSTIDRHIENNPGEDYARYVVTEHGVSPRAVPGGDAFVVCDSDEHNEAGHITEDFAVRTAQYEKRLKKLDGLRSDMLEPNTYGPEDSESVLVCWGSTFMPCREAVDLLTNDGESVRMVHFPQVWPFNVSVAAEALGRKDGAEGPEIICVEQNATAQFASLLSEQGVVQECETMLRYDGRPFSSEEIKERFQQ
ncbi:MAG: 2-oxoacid:acceptor oxidoreductase subunit alpha [Candidatus Brocadiia bacterium]